MPLQNYLYNKGNYKVESIQIVCLLSIFKITSSYLQFVETKYIHRHSRLEYSDKTWLLLGLKKPDSSDSFSDEELQQCSILIFSEWQI